MIFPLVILLIWILKWNGHFLWKVPITCSSPIRFSLLVKINSKVIVLLTTSFTFTWAKHYYIWIYTISLLAYAQYYKFDVPITIISYFYANLHSGLRAASSTPILFTTTISSLPYLLPIIFTQMGYHQQNKAFSLFLNLKSLGSMQWQSFRPDIKAQFISQSARIIPTIYIYNRHKSFPRVL